MANIIDWCGKEKLRIGIATDHGAFDKKNMIVDYLKSKNINIIDFGALTYDKEDDYPDFSAKLLDAMIHGKVDCGILVCTSGVGVGIHANRHHFIRSVFAHTVDSAVKSREHNCTNIIIPGNADASEDLVKEIIDTWLATPFSFEDRHIRRLKQIERYSDDETGQIRAVDSEVADILEEEYIRQSEGIELIASENFTSTAVREAQGSCLTNKYAEGYPGKRYYNGCESVDKVEALAIDRVCELFGAESANVQAHSGSQANMAAYFSLINPGDTVLAMSLDHGGHLTHGMRINFSGKLYNFIGYGVKKDTEQIDYDKMRELALEHNPKLIVAGASAYPRFIDFKRIREIADEVGAYFMTDMAHIAGLVAAGLHPSPVPYCEIVTSTTHKTLRGPRSGIILAKEKYIKKINSSVFPGLQGGPLMHVIAAKAVCFKEAMSEEFKSYQQQVVKNASVLANSLESCGFRIVSGGTDNHLMLVDLRPKHLTGKVLATQLDKAMITVNQNLIPFDPEKPTVTSGIRIGTPAVTTRGMKEEQMKQIAEWISQIADNIDNVEVISKIRSEVFELTNSFSVPKII